MFRSGASSERAHMKGIYLCNTIIRSITRVNNKTERDKEPYVNKKEKNTTQKQINQHKYTNVSDRTEIVLVSL